METVNRIFTRGVICNYEKNNTSYCHARHHAGHGRLFFHRQGHCHHGCPLCRGFHRSCHRDREPGGRGTRGGGRCGGGLHHRRNYGDILTVRSDDDDSEKNYDLSKAEITQEFPFAEGDLVDIIFPYETTEDPVPVIALEVLESVIGQNADPSATGKVTEITDTTLTLELEEGESYTLSIANAYIVSKEGIKADSEATVTYIGDLDDDAMATKVVTEDSYDTAEAELSAFIGKVAQNEEDNIVLESAEGDFYTFVSDDIDFSAYSTGDTLQIFYTGTITDKEISADKVEKK